MWLMQLPHAVVQCQKRFGNVFGGYKKNPTIPQPLVTTQLQDGVQQHGLQHNGSE